MASNSVPVEKYSCRYLDGTQHIDIETDLYNIGNTVEDLQVDGLIQIMDGLTYIQQLVPEELPAPEYKQIPALGDFNIGYQMALSTLPATIPYNSAPSVPSSPGDSSINCYMTPGTLPAKYIPNSFTPSTSVTPGDSNMSYQMMPSTLPATIPHRFAPLTSSLPVDSNISYQMTPSLLPATIPDNFAIPTTSHPPPESNNLSTSVRPPAPKTSLRMSKAAAKGLKQWFDSNSNNPYQNKKETQMLARKYDITVVQVRKWFANRRLRSRKQKKQSASTTKVNKYDFSHLESAFD